MSTHNETMREFFAREYHRLVAFVRSRIADAADSDPYDIVQDVAFGIFDAADIAAPIENASAYVYRALRNRIIDRIRRRRPTQSLDASLGADGDSLTYGETVASTLPGALEQIEAGERRAALRDALRHLDERSRAVVIATEFEDRSFKDLAREWGEPVGTLLSRKSRALKTMLKYLEPSIDRGVL